MDFQSPDSTSPTADPAPVDLPDSLDLSPSGPLVLLRDTEKTLRAKTVTAIAPMLPANAAKKLQQTSEIAEIALDRLAEIDLDRIDDWEMRPARIQMGLVFVGFSALLMVTLLLYLAALHPELSLVDQLRAYWYPYIGFVCLGVSGLFMLGRESMRPPLTIDDKTQDTSPEEQ